MRRIIESYSGSFAGVVVSILVVILAMTYFPMSGLILVCAGVAAIPMLFFIDDIATRETNYQTHRQLDEEIERSLRELYDVKDTLK